MPEFFASVVSKVAAAILCQRSYLANYKSNVEDLKNEVDKLELASVDVQHGVVDARRNGAEIVDDVVKWLSSVEKIMDEAGRLLEDEGKAKNRCFQPSLKARNQLLKKVMTELKAVAGKGKFDNISYYTIPECRSLVDAREFVAFESRKFTLNGILEALSNPNVNMIGVYGLGGIGKTTLVKEVARQAREDKLFDEMVFVEVSQTPDAKKIQGQIADQLDLKFSEESESERAMMLCDRLKKKRKVLVILDNIWTSLDLERAGIPFGDAHMVCKILVTSRSQDVLVSEMHSQNNFSVSILNEEEAWSLFTRMVGDHIKEGEFHSVATDVAKECGGLPISIVTVGRALRNKSLFDWKDALKKLRSPVTGLGARVDSTIELSYSYLEGEELKSIFLLCSLMKHPYDAAVMELLKYGMGLGLFEDAYTMQERRDRVHSLVFKLKDSCLLLDGHTKDSFSMHDIVRDVAISIASTYRHVFTLGTDRDILKNCTAIFLHDCNAGELPERLEYPQLTFFCMNPKDSSFQIPNSFFTGILKLKVLVLSRLQLLSLPSSFDLLINLETLCLDQCFLGDIAVIGNLKKLTRNP